MGIQNILMVAGIAWIVVSILIILRRWRKGFWKLGFKEFFQGTIPLVGVIWVMFAIVGFISSFPHLISWVEGYSIGKEFSEDTLWIINMLPFVYILTGMVAILWIAFKLLAYKSKYTQEEEAYLKDGKLRWKKRLGWFGRFIKVKE